MKQALLKLSPMEIKYSHLYGELPETTFLKNPISGCLLVQKRMDAIWKAMTEENKNKEKSELEKEGCPWLT